MAMTLYANGLITTTGTVVAQSGHVIGVTSFSNNTPTALSGSSNYTLWSAGNVTKKISNSKLIIMGTLPFRDGQSYFMGEWWQIGSSGKRYDGITQHGYASDAGDASVQFGWQIVGEYDSTETGNLAVSVGWTPRNGGSDNPGTTWNPGPNQDGRAQQKSSTLTIIEVAK